MQVGIGMLWLFDGLGFSALEGISVPVMRCCRDAHLGISSISKAPSGAVVFVGSTIANGILEYLCCSAAYCI